MMIFKKAIHRRTFLRGAAATLALPLLDGMIPAFAGKLETAAKPAARLSFVYVPNGIVMEKWTPAAEGAAFEMTPILDPLAPFRDRLLVLSGLNNTSAHALPTESGGPHSHAGAAYLTGVHLKVTGGSDARAGTSVDQLVATEFGRHTQLASLELTLDSTEIVGACEAPYSCAYINTLSWRSPTLPMPMEDNPRVVFERLFGDSNSTDPKERLARIEKDRSILDFFAADASRLLSRVGAQDRAKLTEYLDAIRDVERRIQLAEEKASLDVPLIDRPTGIPETFEKHAKLMFDLQVLAFQSDLTRVITFMMGKETSRRTYRELGISDGHHSLSHHGGDPEKIAKVLKINIYHAKMFAYFLEKLRTTPDGDGSLLDHMILVYGAGISDGNGHGYDNLPTLLVGGGAGQIKGGRHLRYPKGTPMTNLYLTILDKLKMPVERFGDSTGQLNLLSTV